jgi:hypothetical protein
MGQTEKASSRAILDRSTNESSHTLPRADRLLGAITGLSRRSYGVTGRATRDTHHRMVKTARPVWAYWRSPSVLC